ncbi:MAG TPA: alpha/beta hydrolase, partial [Devosiaceae bacterium]|nr:alpha/beta hydrolase [Devosiaceae bacterium]
MIETTQPETGSVAVEGRRIAIRHRAGRAPGLFWLGGFRSDMAGTKAQAIDRFAMREGLEATRFDYSGHGESGGAFLEGTITRWLAESLAVFETQTTDRQIVIGSSMGGWLAMLLNRALRQKGVARVKALVLVAPAVDMTEDLMR